MSDIDDRLDRLESLVEQQQETIEEQQETIAQQRERIADLEVDDSTEEGDDTETVPAVSRRGALTAGGLLALLFGGVGTTSAAQGQVGTSSKPLQALYTEELNGGVTGDTQITTLVGNGLTISSSALSTDLGNGLGFDSSNRIEASSTQSDVHTSTIRFPNGGTADRGDDTSSTTQSYKEGIEIEPQVPLDSIEVRVSSNTSGETTVYLTDTADTPNVLTSTSSPGADNYTTFSYSLNAGQKYYVLVDAGGSDFTLGYNGFVSFPKTSPDVDITNGIVNGGATISDSAYGIDRIRTPSKTSIERIVEWSEPPSVSRWETATYQADPRGETAEVYVETSGDGGSSWLDWRQDPVGPGTDLSAIPSDHRVRFRVELSRLDTNRNVPRVTYLERQWRP